MTDGERQEGSRPAVENEVRTGLGTAATRISKCSDGLDATTKNCWNVDLGGQSGDAPSYTKTTPDLSPISGSQAQESGDKFFAAIQASQARIEADMGTTIQMLAKMQLTITELRAGGLGVWSTKTLEATKSTAAPRRSIAVAGNREKARSAADFAGESSPWFSQGLGTENVDMGATASQQEHGFVATTLPLYWPSSLPHRRCDIANTNALGYAQALAEARISQEMHEPGNAFRHSRWEVFEATKLPRISKFLKSVRDPNSILSIFTELVGVLVLIFDLVTVPYMLGWGITYEGLMNGLALFSLLYWTLDFLTAWIRGYYHDGRLILNLHQIAKRYITTWCPMDFSIVLTEWINLILSSSNPEDTGGSLRFTRVSKLLRVLSAARVVRLARVLDTFMQRCISENSRLVISISGTSFFFLWLNHVTSCLWFWIGTSMPTDTGKRWVDLPWDECNTFCESIPFADAPLFYQYITSFHWAVSQTTLGSMEVNPVSGWERVFNILSLMVGFLFGSTLVSLLSAVMVEIQARNRDRHQKMHMLRRYMIENRVPPAVAQQVQAQVAERLQQQLPVAASQVTALEIVSASLLQELHAEICRPHAMAHPMLAIWACMDVAWFRKFCHASMQIHIYRPNDELFLAGAEATAAYYSLTGVCKYIQEPETSPVTSYTETDVAGKSWMCESALWSKWVHIGTLEALNACQLLLLQAASVGEMVQQNIVIGKIAREYSSCFHRRIVNAKPPHAPYPTDLKVPFTDQGDLVYSMSQQVQVQIGLTALALASSHATRSGIEKLKDEVRAGKSVVILNAHGHAERVVSLVILNLIDSEGRVLYQIGDVASGVMSPKGPILPAVKRLRSELVADALKRLSEDKLHFDGDFAVDKVEDVIEEKQSKLGVHSRYLRKICHARHFDSLPGLICHFVPGRFRTMSDPADPPTEKHKENKEASEAAFLAGQDFFKDSPVTFVANREEEEEEDPNGNRSATGALYCWLSPSDVHLLEDLGDRGLARCLNCLQIPQPEEESYDTEVDEYPWVGI